MQRETQGRQAVRRPIAQSVRPHQKTFVGGAVVIWIGGERATQNLRPGNGERGASRRPTEQVLKGEIEGKVHLHVGSGISAPVADLQQERHIQVPVAPIQVDQPFLNQNPLDPLRGRRRGVGWETGGQLLRTAGWRTRWRHEIGSIEHRLVRSLMDEFRDLLTQPIINPRQRLPYTVPCETLNPVGHSRRGRPLGIPVIVPKRMGPGVWDLRVARDGGDHDDQCPEQWSNGAMEQWSNGAMEQ